MNTQKLKILHLEDMPTDAELVDFTLKRSKLIFEKIVVDNEADYTRALNEYRPDIVLSDHSLPSFNSIEAFNILQQSGLNVPFILITATISEEFAVEIMRNGAADYVLKDRMQRLPNAIENALEKFRLDAERKKYMNEVISNEALLREAEDIANIGSLDIDMETGVAQWSPGLYHILEVEVGEIEPSFNSLFNQMHTDDAARIKREMDEAIAGKAGSVNLYFSIKIDKSDLIKHLHTRLLIERDVSGAATRIKGFAQDITEQKLAEQKIQEAAETQTAILNALPPNIVLINENGKIIAVNESWRKLALFNNLGIPNYGLGYSYLAISEKATGIDRATSAKIEAGIREVIQGKKKEFVMEYASLGGKEWYMMVVAPLHDHTQKGAVILHTNITDRKMAEEMRHKSEANLRTVFENIDLSVILFDTDLKVISYNSNADDAMIRHFNKPLKVGKDIFNYFPKDRRQSVRRAITKVKEHKVASYESNFALPNGELEWYDVKWVGVTNNQNEIVGVILTFKNITEKKNHESERENMTADLAQRNSDLEQFTYIISHNLRAPVANIQGLASLLYDMGPDKAERSGTLEALALSVDNLDKVILDLNQILQVRSQVNDQIELVSLTELLSEIKNGISQMIEKNRVSIHGDFSAVDEVYILKSYLYSILQNLVINSIKYRRPEVDPEIHITSKVSGDWILINVKDNGKGIDLHKYGSHLFGLYKRFDWSVEGKGVGLFMVKMQIESLGGSIGVSSKLNEGTEFMLEFPLVMQPVDSVL